MRKMRLLLLAGMSTWKHRAGGQGGPHRHWDRPPPQSPAPTILSRRSPLASASRRSSAVSRRPQAGLLPGKEAWVRQTDISPRALQSIPISQGCPQGGGGSPLDRVLKDHVGREVPAAAGSTGSGHGPPPWAGWATSSPRPPQCPLLPLPQAAVKIHVALGADLAIDGVGLRGHKAGAAGTSHRVSPQSPPHPTGCYPHHIQSQARRDTAPERDHGSQNPLWVPSPAMGPPNPALVGAREDRIPPVLGASGQSSPTQGSAAALKCWDPPKAEPPAFPSPSQAMPGAALLFAPPRPPGTPHARQDAPALRWVAGRAAPTP